LGDNLGDALRWAAAVSAAAVLTKATGEVRLDEAQNILEKVFLSTNKSISTPQPRFWNT